MAEKITIHQVRKADIIVSTTGHAISKTIRSSIGSDVSHAILYIGNMKVIEAIAEGVTQRPWNQSSEGMTLAIVLRRRNMDDAARQAVIDAAMKYEKLPYDAIGAAGSGMFGSKRGGAIAAAGCVVFPQLCVATAASIRENAKDENADKVFSVRN